MDFGPFDLPTGWLSLLIDTSVETGRRWSETMEGLFDAHPNHYSEVRSAASPAIFAWRFSCPYFDVAAGFSESAAPMYNQVPLLVRAEPPVVYMGSEARRVTVTFHLMAAGQGDGDPRKDVANAAHWLLALNQPTYDDFHLRFSPPPVYVQIGDVLNMRSVAESVQVQWKGPWSPDAASGAVAHGCDVTVQFCSAAKRMVLTGDRGHGGLSRG